MGSHSSSLWLRALLLSAAAISAISACTGSDPATSDTDTSPIAEVPDDAICMDDAAFFEERVQGMVLSPTCSACHHAAGTARESDLILAPTAQPNHLESNRAMLEDIAGLERNGVSLLLLKPIGEEDHGGGAVITTESEAYGILQDFIARLDAPVVCEETETDETEPAPTLELLSPVGTLRKAGLMLTGRLPSADEADHVRFGGEEALRSVLDDMFQEDAFIERIKEIYNDRLLDDGMRAWLNGTMLGEVSTCQGVVNDQFGFDATLNQGWNRLLIKVRDHGGGWGLSARFLDSQGEPIASRALSLMPGGAYTDNQRDADGDGIGDLCDPAPGTPGSQ